MFFAVGRMGENIVTNELLARGFLVTHLDKGTRGVSANADLLVGHAKLKRPILIQVKACVSPQLQRVFFGGFSEDALRGHRRLFNHKPGFHADFIASVCLRSPKEYRVFMLPIEKIERMLIEAYKKWHKVPTRAGDSRRPVPTMYVSVGPNTLRTNKPTSRNSIFRDVGTIVLKHEDAYHLLLGPRTSKSGAPMIINFNSSPDINQ